VKKVLTVNGSADILGDLKEEEVLRVIKKRDKASGDSGSFGVLEGAWQSSGNASISGNTFFQSFYVLPRYLK